MPKAVNALISISGLILLLGGGTALLSCGKAPHASLAPTPSPAAVPAPTPSAGIHFRETKALRPWRIAFIPKFKYYGKTGALSSYWGLAWEGARKAGTDFGVEVSLIASKAPGETDADYVEPQIRLVADLIARGGCDGLLIAPFDSNRLAPVIEKAVAAGIPVVAMDTPVNSDRALTLVAFDNASGARAVGEWVVVKLGGRGRVLLLDGPPDQQNAIDRKSGFLAGLRTGDIDVLNAKSADWEIEPARAIMAGWLKKYPRIDAVLAANDNMALGAARAIAEAKRRGIVVTGFDASEEAKAAIREGRMAATVDQAPGDQARLAIQLLIERLESGTLPPSRVLLSEISIVTRDSAGQSRPAISAPAVTP
jgi:ABC-type sugar transport system substrate-binding protein